MNKLDQLLKLYGEPLVSKCCNKKIIIKWSDNGKNEYTCKACQMPCEILLLKDIGLPR